MMFDPLYYFEKAAKAVRGGILAASDNLAFLLDGLCRTPEPLTAAKAADFLINKAGPCGSPGLPKMACHRHIGHSGDHTYSKVRPDSAAGSPPNSVAVVAPSPKQGSDSGPADSTIPPVPAGPHPDLTTAELFAAAADWIRCSARVSPLDGVQQRWAEELINELDRRAAQFEATGAVVNRKK